MQLLCRGTGDAVLFIHGMPTSNQLWQGIIEQMCGKHTCFAIDLPGFGKTPWEPYEGGYLDRLARRIDVLRAENDIDKWHVVGHDAGSAIAVHYTHSFQERVDSLVLLSPALFPDLKPYHLLECLRKPIMGEFLAPLLSTVFWNFAMRLAARNEEGAAGLCPSSFREPFSGWKGAWSFMRVLRWGKPSEVLAHVPGILPEILVPTLIFQGLRDPAIPERFAQRAHALIPNCQLVYVDCGHFIPLNRPLFTADRLLQFFSDFSTEKIGNDRPLLAVP
jgi:pimeloyl-ACP methyl ester carboxylesterase